MLLKICAVHCSHFLGVILGLPIPGFVAYQQKYGKPDAETREFHSFILKYARPDPDLVKIWFADFAVGPSGLNLGSLKLRFRVYRKFIVGGWRKVAKQWRKTMQW